MADTTPRSGSRPWDWLPFFSQAGWVDDLAGHPQGVPLQRLDRPRLIEVQHEIELLWQPRMDVVTDPLALGRIQDADRAFQNQAALNRPAASSFAARSHDSSVTDQIVSGARIMPPNGGRSRLSEQGRPIHGICSAVKRSLPFPRLLPP